MPRLTRAQLRAQEAEGGPQPIHEDPEVASASPTQDHDILSSELSSRPPLGELHANNTPAQDPQQTQASPIAKKMKGPKTDKAGGKHTLDLTLANNENFLPGIVQEVLEDESQSDVSSAAELAAEDLRKDQPVPESFQVPMDTTRPRTPPSVAAKEASRSLSRSPEKRSIAVHGPAVRTPKFDPVVHAKMPSAEQTKEDSFVQSIRKTPSKITASQEVVGDGPDSFVEDIISRSPSKFVARIEDSVEAIDALEEAIEQVSEGLPKAIAEGLESPVKIRTPHKVKPKRSPKQTTSRSAPSTKKSTMPSVSATISAPTTKSSVPDKPAARKPAPRLSTARPQSRPATSTNLLSSVKPSLESVSVAAALPPSTTTTTTTKRAPSNTARHLSTSRPGFVPSKSAKAPTKSTFSLPGDAISAKLKAQREERQKKEEAEAEAAKKRTEFKARPVPKAIATAAAGTRHASGRVSSISVPRDTAASRARMSLMVAKKEMESSGYKDHTTGAGGARKAGAEAGFRSMRAAGPAARQSVLPPTAQFGLSVTKTRARPSIPAAASGRVNKPSVPTNSSFLRCNTKSYLTAASKTRQSSIQVQPTTCATSRTPLAASNGSPSTARSPRTTTAAAAATTQGIAGVDAGAAGRGTVKGKELFSRGKMAEEELLKQKREKEDAARKARADASERGRKASREWAERQRKRKMEAGVKGLSGKTEREVVVAVLEEELWNCKPVTTRASRNHGPR